ncbi:DUF3107 domain-containing protein [Mycobacterium sherrisii]|nr:DUF3107 domain-containing protein [Mycobacterium sherrisii]
MPAAVPNGHLDPAENESLSAVRNGFAYRELAPVTSAPVASTNLQLTRLRRRTTEGAIVEVKVGITDSPRELVFTSAQTPAEVEDAVNAALREGPGLLSLTDEKGRRYLIQTAKIAYVEIGAADSRRVGFGIGLGADPKSSGKAR